MKRLLEEIRSQPAHIREIFMWSCVVIVFSMVGFVWFKQTTKQFVALMHPEEAQERALAEKEGVGSTELATGQSKLLSPFATILNAVSDLRANISELLMGPESMDINIQPLAPEKEIPPQRLPLSE